MQTSTIGAIIRGLKRSLAATFALSSVSIASLLWASPSRALPFTSTPAWNFLPPTPGNNKNFGSSVALSGNNALIGAWGVNNFSGAAYLYDVSTGSLLQSFLNPNPPGYDYFGGSVALSGNNALIGSYGENNFSGAAYLYASTSSASTTQSQSVPGPLPLLALGAAFAWSRKLRRRTRQNIALSEQLD